MSIWNRTVSPEDLTRWGEESLAGRLGIEFTEIGDDFIKASMPVHRQTHQPMGILHGGASVALAETVASVAANLTTEPGYHCVGFEINANHVRSVKNGYVFAIAKPLHIGRSTQVWEINITNEQDQPVCVSRLTLGVMESKNE